METDFILTRRARSSIVVALSLLLAASGCALTRPRSTWRPPAPLSAADGCSDVACHLAAAEAQYAAGLEAENAGQPVAVDHYFAAAVQLWPYQATAANAGDDRSTELYRSSVQQLIASAARCGRLDPRRGIRLASGQWVPITYHAFVWQPEDFGTFLPVGSYSSGRFTNRYVSCGVGVPYVVLSGPARRQLIGNCQPFAATAVVEPSAAYGGAFALALYDPLRTSSSATGLPLARDLTAPIAYAASQEGDLWLEGFLDPDRDDSADGLRMREPYQPGKIPLVLVHGLLSDPLTWCELENDLRADPAIFTRYQIWTFRYDTGDPFLASAATLRRQLAEARQVYDPCRADPNMSRMVVVGHSLGGLVAKLQVTQSGDALWQAAATRPLETICTDPATRADLANAFFFQPSSDVSRVIYIATPHRGSIYARRCIGRVSSSLVEVPRQWQQRHAQLVRDNPGAFRGELERRIPTSIDLLEPNSLILQATERLPYRYGVALHSVIGNDRWTLGQGPSDGVVAVSSAQLAGVQSELFVDAEHTRVQRVPNTVREVTCILNQHAATAAQLRPLVVESWFE